MTVIDVVAIESRGAMRSVWRTKWVSAVIVLSLSLGTCSVAFLYGFAQAAFLAKLPVSEPDELVSLRWRSREWFPEMDRFSGSGSVYRGQRHSPTVSTEVFRSIERDSAPLGSVWAFARPYSAVYSDATTGTTERAWAQAVSGQFFVGLGVRPLQGRLIVAADDTHSAPPVALVSAAFWRRQLGASPDTVGTTVFLGGRPHTVIGIAAEEFVGVEPLAAVVPDVWIPLASESKSSVSGQPLWGLSVMGRLPGDIDRGVAAARLGVVFRSELLATENVPANDVPVLHLTNAAKGTLPEGPNHSEELGAVIAGLATALLVVVSIHAGNILVTRARLRAPEFSVRAMLGATRVRMFNQLAMEAIVLCSVSGVVGVLLYHWMSRVVGASGLLPPGLRLETDWAVVLLTIVASLTLAVAFALVSTVRAAQDTAASAWTWRNAGRRRASRVVLVVQVATTVLLLSGAVLMAQLASRWRAPDLSFDPAKVVVVGLSADGAGTDSASLAADLRSAALTLPGVTAASVTGAFWDESTFGQVFTSGERIQLRGRWFPIDPYLCDTLSLSLVAGRCFRADEGHREAAVAVLSESAATALFGRTNAVGRSVALDPQGKGYTVVGVVRDLWGAQMSGLSNPIVFLPIGARPGDIYPSEVRRLALQQNSGLSLVTRLQGPSPQLRAELERLALSGTPVTIIDVETVARRLARQAEPLRLGAAAWWAFGAAALMLSVIGLYGLVDHQISSRRREFGIRLALGAKPIDVGRLALRDTVVVVSAGLVMGCAVSTLGAVTGRAMVSGAPEMTWQVLLTVATTVIVSASAAVVGPLRSIRTKDAASLLRCD